MSTTKHSKAPFSYDTCAGCKDIFDADRQDIANTTGLFDEDEDEANARLFAAAPDLLDACKFSLSVHEAQGLYDLSERLAADTLRAAIALAQPEPAEAVR